MAQTVPTCSFKSNLHLKVEGVSIYLCDNKTYSNFNLKKKKTLPTSKAKASLPFVPELASIFHPKNKTIPLLVSYLAFNTPPTQVFKLSQEGIWQTESGRAELLSYKADLNCFFLYLLDTLFD